MKMNRRTFLRSTTVASLTFSGGCGEPPAAPKEAVDPTKPLRITAELIAKCEGHEGPVQSVDISPDGKTLVTGSSDRTMRFWSVADGKPLHKVQVIDPAEKYGHVGLTRFTPDGKSVLAYALTPRGIRVSFWDVGTGKETNRRVPIEGNVIMALSPDGARLASYNPREGVDLWDVERGRKLRTFRYSEDNIGSCACLAFSPDGKLLAAGLGPIRFGKAFLPKSPALLVWDLKTGKEVFRGYDHLEGRDGGKPPSAIAFSPDSKRLVAAGGRDGTIRTWDAETWKPGRTIQAKQDNVFSFAFHPGGRLLVSGGTEGKINLWDVTGGELAARIEGHTGSVGETVFSRSGEVLASVCGDKLVMLWRIVFK